ncbi:DUF6531 domain-containing protein [Kosakonia sp. ML.JS2a]|uniref:RHS repeat-associated core domain-containing protein n=1 Tax=Kosakonia sp. ML.JS2a TaxID=2980557 RepID=UPI0021DB79A7|nr:RHS repeat-associated core domain-containing protein [Kosakonia sp. ML.JS2a]UXY11199.1 DUF6531 domain-containing protein [Kosakonia sp. ML.JS2a]
MTDYIAARIDDPLIHSSALADFVGGMVEGAIVWGVIAFVGTGVGLLVAGVALAGLAALIFSGKLEEIGNAAGKVVDALIDPGPPDAIIVSGSDNVHIKGKKAARAAGTVDRDYLNSPAAADEGIDWAAVGMVALAVAATAAKTILTPGGVMMAVAERAKDITLDDLKKWGTSFWETLTQPVVESANPHATPMPKDNVDCKKGHMVTSSNFVAQGSKKVLINNQPAARNGEKSTCEAEIKVSDDPRVRIGGDTITVRDIHSGKNQLAYLLGNLMGSVGLGALSRLAKLACERQLLRGLAKEFLCLLGGVAVSDTLSAALISAAHTFFPVHIPLGSKILAKEEDLDFVLPDRMPLYWQRIYHSRNRATGILGTGWMMPFETRFLRLADNQMIFRDMSGRELGLGEVLVGDMIFYPEDGMRIFASPNGIIAMQTGDGEHQIYEPDPTRSGEWRIQRIYDRHENAHYYSWNEKGQLTRISSDNEALDVELEYESRFGRLSAVYQICAGERRLLVSYRYNDQGQLITVTDADGVVTRQFGWDRASDMLAWHSFSTGLTVHYQWRPEAGSEHWRVSGYQVHDEQGAVLENWRIDADEQKRYARVSNDEGVVSEHHWDTLYRITDYTDVHGGHWQFNWAGNAEQLRSALQPDGGRWEYTWDERGNLTLERDPLDRARMTTWHPLYDFPAIEVLPDGATWRYEYNLAGDVVALTDPEGGVTRFEWNDQGDLTRRIDALENSHRFWWDELGQLIREEDCSGHQSRRQYDAAGRLAAVTDPLGNTDRYRWSAASRLQTFVRADGREMLFKYNKAGLLCGQNIDGMLERNVTLNARGQVTEAVDSAGQVTRFTFNRAGRLVTLTNANNQQWRFDYTTTGLLTRQQDYAGRQTEYQYNTAQQVATMTRHPARGSALPPQVVNYEYDALGRMVARETEQHRTEYRYSALATEIRRYAYGEWRQSVIDMREPQSIDTIILTRNKLGDLVSEENASGKYEHQYDALSNLSATTFPDGRQMQYLRYGTGHLLEMQLSFGGKTLPVTGYQRDKLHRETQRTLGALALDTEYDVAGRITQRRCMDNVRNRLVFERRYQWDRADQIIRQMYTDGAPATPAEKYRQSLWGYDAAGRMTQSLQPGGEERFWYDAADNRTTPDLQPVWDNLLKRLDGVRREYDGFGRMTERHDSHRGITQRFSYDDEQRISAVVIEGDPAFTRAEYRYDALGRRTEKQVWRRHTRKPERTQYAWSGLQMVGERSDSDPDAAVQYVYTENSYEPLARIDSRQQHAEMYWYHTEINGLPEKVTDSRGEVVWHGTSTAWGRSQHESVHAEWDVPQNLRFQGQYLDRETGLHYNTFRYYDPTGGCYTQMDPIGLQGGLNTYTYVIDPLGWVDPLGLWTYNTMPGIDGFQKHHVIPQQLKGHDLLKAADYNIHDVRNVIYLPKSADYHPVRTIHSGSHPVYTQNIKEQMTEVFKYGSDNNWTKEDYRLAVDGIIKNERADLRNGKTVLNKNSIKRGRC